MWYPHRAIAGVHSLCAVSGTSSAANKSVSSSHGAVDGVLSVGGRVVAAVERRGWAGHHADLLTSLVNATYVAPVSARRKLLEASGGGASLSGFRGTFGLRPACDSAFETRTFAGRSTHHRNP